VISAAIATGAKLAAEIERAATVSAFLNVYFISLSFNRVTAERDERTIKGKYDKFMTVCIVLKKPYKTMI